MNVIADLDPVQLEAELLNRVDALHGREGGGDCLIVVPTHLLANHLRLRLAERRPAWIGLEIHHFDSLACRILEQAGATPPEPLSARMLDALLRGVLREFPENRFSRFVSERPGALGRIRASINELREAGLRPRQVADGLAGDEDGMALAELYAGYVTRIDRQKRSGWSDRTGRIVAALSGAESFAGHFVATFVHGAYETIGVHLELLQRIERSSPVTFLLPGADERRVASYSSEFARKFLGESLEPITGDRERVLHLEALYDEDAAPPAADGIEFVFRHVRGEAAEVEIAVREALAAVEQGVAPREIVIAARDLAPYASALEEALQDTGLPWVTTLSGPLRRQPAIHDFLLLLHVVSEDFPRRATAELLRSPRLRWSRLLPQGARMHGDRADPWSRQARIVGGLDEWTQDLPAWAAEPTLYAGQTDRVVADAREAARHREVLAGTIADAVRSVHGRIAPAARRWPEHARVLAGLVDGDGSLIDWREDPATEAARDALLDLIDELGRLDQLLDDSRRVSFAEMLAWLEEAVEGIELPVTFEDQGGIRVLDSMQLRGLTCDRLLFLGMNAGRFPRVARDDPILGDEARAMLRQRFDRPLSIRQQANGEERLLLSMILGAARQRVDISWQRADESGRARTPSLALREVARVAIGTPDMERLRDSTAGITRHLPSHPTQWLDELAASPGLLSPGEERLLAALESGGALTAGPVANSYPELAPGITMLRATESFRFEDDAFDGRLGRSACLDELSVSALETLGRCPLQYFFNRILRVRELDNPAATLAVDARELGLTIHALLERIYRQAADEGLFAEQDAERLTARGVALMHEDQERILGDLGARLGRRVPVLWDHFRKGWVSALQDFLERDLFNLADGGLEPVDFEEDCRKRLDFGEGVVQGVRGRFDRRFAGNGKLRIGDYKTGRKLKDRVNPTDLLKGHYPQVPLYHKLAGAEAEIELLGIGPNWSDGEESRFVFAGFKKPEQTAGFDETMRILLGLLDRGTFPLHPGAHCNWCEYSRGCRNAHPPTQAREDHAEDIRDYRELDGKQRTKPTLDDVRGAS